MAYTTDTYIAGNKFGLGLRAQEGAYIESDPRGWLSEQLETITNTPVRLSSLSTSASYLNSLSENRMSMQRMRQNDNQEEQQRAFRESRREMAQEQQAHNLLRLQTAIETDSPFTERLVQFWSNHFTVAFSGGPKDIIRQIGVPFEQEAIRQNLDQSFSSMLLAVEQHPAMLVYLDNTASIGPKSTIGSRRDRGLNENLAREILELHTLGVNGGYDQEDVTSLAKIITGWTIPDQRTGRLPGASINPTTGFAYVPQLHEPGSQTLLGKNYTNAGQVQGEQALHDLATHPSTARHIAEKLARHFVSDEPPESAISTLENTFLETSGDLPSVHAALIDLDEAWQSQHRKLKTPQDLVVSSARAMELDDVINDEPRVAGLFTRILGTFNQAPFTALSPKGWEDSASYWGGPDALMKRMEWANSVANFTSRSGDAAELAEQLLPFDAHLQQELDNAESSHQVVTLLLASPSFQWR